VESESFRDHQKWVLFCLVYRLLRLPFSKNARVEISRTFFHTISKTLAKIGTAIIEDFNSGTGARLVNLAPI